MFIDYSRGPLPDLSNPVFLPFWEAASNKELRFPKCRNCNQFHWYVQILCPHCQSRDMEWVKVKGHGTVYTWTTVRHAFLPEFESRLPFIAVIVLFQDAPGIRFIANLVDCKPEDVRIGMAVEIFFQKVNEEVTIPLFRPIRN